MIWLLRHGDAEDGSPDEQRRLTEKGERQARAAGAALKALGVEPSACLSSPRVRAADTAKLACEPLGGEVELVEALSGGSFDPEELAAGHDGDVILVGHEPDFSEAVQRLTGARIDLKKGGVAAVENGELRALLRPKELKAVAGH
ncbi:MAG TPA: histidine phosphatase family protein [Thermoleophilaceae bacterium]|nr:histidine phosphatase family protein [Thermoleophilaceae bacterium]